jgi:hypothetical protein
MRGAELLVVCIGLAMPVGQALVGDGEFVDPLDQVLLGISSSC